MWSTILEAAETMWAWLPALTTGLKFATALLAFIAAAVSLGRRCRRRRKNPHSGCAAVRGAKGDQGAAPRPASEQAHPYPSDEPAHRVTDHDHPTRSLRLAGVAEVRVHDHVKPFGGLRNAAAEVEGHRHHPPHPIPGGPGRLARRWRRTA